MEALLTSSGQFNGNGHSGVARYSAAIFVGRKGRMELPIKVFTAEGSGYGNSIAFLAVDSANPVACTESSKDKAIVAALIEAGVIHVIDTDEVRSQKRKAEREQFAAKLKAEQVPTKEELEAF